MVSTWLLFVCLFVFIQEQIYGHTKCTPNSQSVLPLCKARDNKNEKIMECINWRSKMLEMHGKMQFKYHGELFVVGGCGAAYVHA